MNKYTQQEVREFFKNMHEPKDGCYSFHTPTWSKMCKEHPNLVVELQIERLSETTDKLYQRICDDISNVEQQVNYGDCNKFPWYELGCGFAIGSLFWGIMFALFGGS